MMGSKFRLVVLRKVMKIFDIMMCFSRSPQFSWMWVLLEFWKQKWVFNKMASSGLSKIAILEPDNNCEMLGSDIVCVEAAVGCWAFLKHVLLRWSEYKTGCLFLERSNWVLYWDSLGVTWNCKRKEGYPTFGWKPKCLDCMVCKCVTGLIWTPPFGWISPLWTMKQCMSFSFLTCHICVKQKQSTQSFQFRS